MLGSGYVLRADPPGNGVGPSGSVTFATWNPADIGSNVTLSNGNLTAASNGANSMARSTISKSSGKWFWEITQNSHTTNNMLVGIATAASALTAAGATATSWGYYGDSGNKFNNNVGAAYGAVYTDLVVIGIALDIDAGTLIFYNNGVSQGTAFTGLSGTFFAAGCGAGGNAQQGTANFGASAFAFSVPGGYNAGLYA